MDFLHEKGYTYHDIPTLTLWELRELKDGHAVRQRERERQQRDGDGPKPGQKGRKVTRKKQAELSKFGDEIGSDDWYSNHAAELQRQPAN